MIVSKSQKWLVVVILVTIHLTITIPLAYWVNIWSDEASSLYTTNAGPVAAIQDAITNEKQAPLYFAILAAWRALDQSIFFSRLLSIIFSVAAIVLFSGIAFRRFAKHVATIASCFFALHPFLIWAGTEIRVYSMVVFLSTALITLFDGAFPQVTDGGRSSAKARFWFIVIAALSLYTNYYLGFLFAGLLCVLALRGEWKNVFRYVVLMLIVGILCVPLVYIVALQMEMNTAGFQPDRTAFAGIRFIWHHALTFILPAEIFPDETSSLVSMIRLALVRLALLGVGILAVIRWRSLSTGTYSYAVIAAVMSSLFFASYWVMGEEYVAIRHAAVLFVPLILLFTSSLTDLLGEATFRPGVRRVLFPAASLVVLSFFAYSIVTLYPNMKKRGDWESVANFIQIHENDGDPILVFPTYDALALKTYYNGPNAVLPDKDFFDFQLEDEPSSPKSMVRRIDFAILQIPQHSSRLWLLDNPMCITTDACVPLENYLEANYTVTVQRDFYHERVRLLTRKPQ